MTAAAKAPTACEGVANVFAALDYIPKQRSAGVNYEFRSIDAVMNVLHELLAANRLFLRPRVLDDWRVQMILGTKDREQVQAVFRVAVDAVASDGSSVELGVGMAQSHDYGDKAVYQAQQNAVKYVLIEAFCIPTADPDMDGRESDPVPAARRAESPPAPRDGTQAPKDAPPAEPATDEQRGAIVDSLSRLPLPEKLSAEATLANTAGAKWLDDLDTQQAAKTIAWLQSKHDRLRDEVSA